MQVFVILYQPHSQLAGESDAAPMVAMLALPLSINRTPPPPPPHRGTSLMNRLTRYKILALISQHVFVGLCLKKQAISYRFVKA
jgi:hypothetical protein